MKITTKTGDKGYTGLLSGQRVPKYDLRPIAYGTLDEANSILGAARASSQVEEIQKIIETLQKELFLIGAELAACPDGIKYLKERVTEREVQKLEDWIQWIEDNIDVPEAFIIPGATLTSAFIDIARTVIRRVERTATKLGHENLLSNEQVTIYLNRLSDLLFLLARYEEQVISGKKPRFMREETEEAGVSLTTAGL